MALFRAERQLRVPLCSSCRSAISSSPDIPPLPDTVCAELFLSPSRTKPAWRSRTPPAGEAQIENGTVSTSRGASGGLVRHAELHRPLAEVCVRGHFDFFELNALPAQAKRPTENHRRRFASLSVQGTHLARRRSLRFVRCLDIQSFTAHPTTFAIHTQRNTSIPSNPHFVCPDVFLCGTMRHHREQRQWTKAKTRRHQQYLKCVEVVRQNLLPYSAPQT